MTAMNRKQTEPLFVQDDEYDAQNGGDGHQAAAQASQNIMILDDAENEDDIQEIPATQATAVQPATQTTALEPTTQATAVQQSQAPPSEEVVDLTVDDAQQPEQYRLTRFNQSIPRSEVYTRLRSKYSQVYKRQSIIAMPDTRVKQRLDDIAGSVLTKPIGYVIDRDQKAWAQELRSQKRALTGELQVLETFIEEKLQRADYRRAFRKNLLKDARAKLSRIEEDLKLREKLIEEMKIFAKQD